MRSELPKFIFISVFGTALTILLASACDVKSCQTEELHCTPPYHKKCETWYMPMMFGDTTMLMPMDDCKCIEGSDK